MDRVTSKGATAVSKRTPQLVLAAMVLCAVEGLADDPPRLATKWAATVNPDAPLPEYPRPQMVRERWLNLNGRWEYAVRSGEQPAPATFDGRIVVPFAIESALSGVRRALQPEERLWYRRTFDAPADWRGQRVLLHFGAVDWEAEVWLNGTALGVHRGGYDPFSFDVTAALRAQGPQELVVAVRDPTDAGAQPRGKQVRKPNGIWYTSVSGIWQTVWLEPIPATAIRGMRIESALEPDQLSIQALTDGGDAADLRLRVAALADGREVAATEGAPGAALALAIPDARRWSPDDPFLYSLRVELRRGDAVLDAVESYAGIREVRVAADRAGIPRIELNRRPVFQFGPLDQGFWPDGLYTAPSDEALRFDVEAVRRMGGNMLRKHVKVEPARLYYWCDRLGVLVWQDMPSGDNPPEARGQFEVELRAMIEALRNHPSIVMWVPFNEGWGQYDTPRVVEAVRSWDASRLVNNASGWTDAGVGDTIDVHSYPGPSMAAVEPRRASVLGEFGGLGLPVVGHTWVNKDNWGYVSYASPVELTDAYVALIEKLPGLIAQGLCAAVYTQTTDVEIEVNGWLTYDRAVWKVDPERAARAAKVLAEPARTVRPVSASANSGEVMWRYSTQSPASNWHAPEFDDGGWAQGRASFGTRETPGARVGTEWKTSEIWLRREFDFDGRGLESPHLLIHHDEDAAVYLNGVRVAEFSGYSTAYELHALADAGRAALRRGRNVLAVHCRQTRGGQNIDVGIVELLPAQRD